MPTQMPTYRDQLVARKRAHEMLPDPITHHLEIAWNAKAKKWVVSEPLAAVWRDIDKVEWKLVRDQNHLHVSAHFQFADLSLFTDFDEQDRLSKDKTAVIGADEETLTLKVHKDACRRTNPHHYAVWISDKEHRHGGEYAVGKDLNPPPEISVGP